MKTIIVLLCMVVLVLAQLTLQDIDTPESAQKWEHKVNVDSIGVRETVTQLSTYKYLVTGTLYGKTFVAIQTDNREQDQTCVRKKRITVIQLERMQIAYISVPSLDRMLNGNYKAKIYPLVGNAISGYSSSDTYTGTIKLNNTNKDRQFLEWKLDYSKYTDTIYIKK